MATNHRHLIFVSIAIFCVAVGAVAIMCAMSRGTPSKKSEAKADVKQVLVDLHAGAYEGWDFTAPIRKHGNSGIELLIEEARPSADYRYEALFLLGSFSDIDHSVIETIESALEDPDTDIRRVAVRALGRAGRHAKGCLDSLRARRKKPEWSSDVLAFHLDIAIKSIERDLAHEQR